ncbi:MAG: Bax inhibitor-1/YccA family protein [Acidimicrobiia bacterium]
MPNPVLTSQFGTAEKPTAGSAPIIDTGDYMTMSSVLKQTGLLFMLLVAAAVYGWNQASVEGLGPIFWGALIASIVLMIVTFVKKEWVRFTAPLYALAQGVLVGAISKIYSDVYDGIVVQAVLATFAVFIAMLFMYANRIIKVTQRLRSTVMLATAGVLLFYLISIVLSLFGVDIPFIWDGGPFSILLSVIIVGIASFNLLLDFDVIERGIDNRAPSWFSWFAAFGLMVTVVWLYIEILRLLALTRD